MDTTNDLKMRKKINTTEKSLKVIEAALKKRVSEIGSSKAGRICDLPRQYFTNYLHNDKNPSFGQVLKLAKKIFT